MTTDAAPFAPIDHASLSPQARHDLKAAINAGTEEALAAWHSKNNRNTVGSPGEVSAPAVDPAVPAVDPALTDMAAKFEEHGSSIEIVQALATPMAKFHERLASLDDEAMAKAMADGEDRILREHYRGSEAAYTAGLTEIRDAALKVGIDPKGIADSGILCDPDLHWRALCLARSVLRGKSTP